MNQLTLDKTIPEIAKAVAGCKVGVPKELKVTIVPTEDNPDMLVADVTKVSYTAPPKSTPAYEEPGGEIPQAVIAISAKGRKAEAQA